jgi:nucleoid-associated protein YgaU
LAQPAQKEKPASPELVRVEKGDSLWKIADRLLGHGEEWKKIAAANPEMADPNCILPGQWLRLPAPAPAASAVKRAQQVSVQGGDSLWKLAQAQWGSGQAWSCIAAANPQIEFADLIYPGQVLNIPSSCSEIASAIRPTIP